MHGHFLKILKGRKECTNARIDPHLTDAEDERFDEAAHIPEIAEP